MTIPTLTTEWLVLRASCADDFDGYAQFYADAEASGAYGGPLSAGEAWRKLLSDLGHWQVRGYGMWTVCWRETGQMAGGCGLVWPYDWPCPELTWWVLPDARRKGVAMEASRAAIQFGYDQLGWDEVCTYMNDDNIPAQTLAEKLGGRIKARVECPDGLSRNIYVLPRLQG